MSNIAPVVEPVRRVTVPVQSPSELLLASKAVKVKLPEPPDTEPEEGVNLLVVLFQYNVPADVEDQLAVYVVPSGDAPVGDKLIAPVISLVIT